MDRKDLTRMIESLRADLEDAEKAWTAANQRVLHLRRAMDGLKGYLATTPAEHEPEKVTVTEVAVADEAELPTIDFGAKTAGSNGNGNKIPRPREAVLVILREQPRTWTLADLVAEMARRGWTYTELSRPSEAIRAAANRLAEVEHMILRVDVSSYGPLPKPANVAGNH